MTTTTHLSAPAAEAVRYLAPTRFDKLLNRLVRRLTRLGISVWGSREIRIVGRKSGMVRANVVNLLTVDAQRYLVSPRGTTDWVRNLRAAGEGELRVGRRTETFRAVELADDEKTDVLRAYLERWAFEVGRFFEGVDATSSDDELARVAPQFPAFRVIA